MKFYFLECVYCHLALRLDPPIIASALNYVCPKCEDKISDDIEL